MFKTRILGMAMLLMSLSATEAATENWKPVEQTNLAALVESAPNLHFENLSDGPDSCWQGPLWWVPNPDGKTWDLVVFYYPAYPGPNEVFIYDTGSKELKKVAIPELTSVLFGFHLNRFFLIKGKAYIASGYGPVALFTYDPAKNDFQFGGYPLGREGDRVVFGVEGLITVNQDGTLIGGFGPLTAKRKQPAFYTIDPVTLKGDFLGAVGPENPNIAWEYRRVAIDGDWIYASVGHSPWRLYGMNVKTRQGLVLAETERFMGDRSTIRFLPNNSYPGLYVSITGLKGGPQDKTSAFWLRDGKMTPCEPVGNNIIPTPPWVDEKLARPRPNFLGAFDENDPPPKGIEVFRGPVDQEGKVRTWYRYTDEAMAQAAAVKKGEWQSFSFSVKLTPSSIRRMSPLPDGSIFALTEGYGRAVSYNPKTRQRKPLGPTMSVYSTCLVEQKLYLSGYPGSQVWIYDPTRPWTVGQNPDAPPAILTGSKELQATSNSNPSFAAYLKDFTDVHMPWATAAGADGRIYFGGKVVRIGNGGGLGWWDTRENKAGGLHEPFDSYTIFWMCTASTGRYVICSTKGVPARNNPDLIPPRGRLFVYDTATHAIIRQIEDDRLTPFPGYVTEALPGLVMGCAPTTNQTNGLLYGFDPEAGRVLWTKPLPLSPETGFSAMKKGRYHFGKGPDGFIWATLGGVLVRINPKTVEVVPVGKMEDNPLAFIGGDVFVGGSNQFRRITGLPGMPAPVNTPPTAD